MQDLHTPRKGHTPHKSDLREIIQDREGAQALLPTGFMLSFMGGSLSTWCGLKRHSPALLLLGGLGIITGTIGLSIHLCRSSSTSFLGRRKIRPSRAVKTEASILVNRRREDLFQFWRNFENLPRFMDHILKVERLSPTRSRWVMNVPNIENIRGPSTIEWEAEIINEKEGELIGWRSLVNTKVDHAGSVRFNPIEDGSKTDVRVTLQYSPFGGLIGIGIVKLLGEDPQHKIQEDLLRFKALMEAGLDY